jgi:hypothetical protein
VIHLSLIRMHPRPSTGGICDNYDKVSKLMPNMLSYSVSQSSSAMVYVENTNQCVNSLAKDQFNYSGTTAITADHQTRTKF